jgi:multidrug efflux system membrane fusion protein
MKLLHASSPCQLSSLLAVAMATLFLAACSPPPAAPEAPKLVRTRIAAAAEGSNVRRYSGEVRGRYETALAFRIPGKLVKRLVDAGASVKAGQALARIDAADAALQAGQAEAQRAQAEAELKRYRELRAKNFISQSALDARETAYKAAAAQAGLARNQSAYTTLSADRSGVIGAVLAESGQVVAAGQPVFRLVPDGDREVIVSIPESELAAFKVGDEARVELWSADGEPLQGRLREIAAVADPATRTYATRVSLPEAAPRLPVGLTASVVFVRNDAGAAITVPLSAIFQKDGKPAIWVVSKENAATLRAVSVLRYTDSGALIGSGLEPGERYVEAGVHKLVAGETLRIAATPAAAVVTK